MDIQFWDLQDGCRCVHRGASRAGVTIHPAELNARLLRSLCRLSRDVHYHEPFEGRPLKMRLTRPLLFLSFALVAACSRGVPITQAQATCQNNGGDTGDVALHAWYLGEGWGPPHESEHFPAATGHVRFLADADLGPETPLRGIQVRVEDDHDVFPNPPPAEKSHMTITGTFTCTNQRAHYVMLGHLVPTSIVIDK
jgi:hypothetical protein